MIDRIKRQFFWPLLLTLLSPSCTYSDFAGKIATVPKDEIVIFGRFDYPNVGSALSLILFPAAQMSALENNDYKAIRQNKDYVTPWEGRQFYKAIKRKDYAVLEFYGNERFSIVCPGLRINPAEDAVAVYIGKMVLRQHLKEETLFKKTFDYSLAIEDFFDEEAAEFRKTHPEFVGKVAKALVAPPTAPAGSEIECKIQIEWSLPWLFWPV